MKATYWFRSKHVGSDKGTPLPILGIRLAPRLDDHNRAPSGRTFTFPVHVGHQAGVASYDDGRTWHPVRLTGRGEDRTAIVTHPNAPSYVSLRAMGIDTAGNGIEQEIIHAYALSG